jgi:chromate transporter
MSEASRSGPSVAPVSPTQLFLVFLKVSMLAFGGGLAWARQTVVAERRWLTDEEFADIVSLCQFMPGPNIVGIAVCVGARLGEGRGALAALAGFILIPWTIGFALGTIYLHYAYIPVLQNILAAVSAAAAGLLIATGIRLLAPHRARPAALLFAALAFAGVALLKLPLLAVLLALGPLGIAVAAMGRGRWA